MDASGPGESKDGPFRPTTWVGGGPSFLPNLGLQLGVGRTIGAGPTTTRALELHGAWQFLDDEDFADDGNPRAGPWYQVRGGVRWSSARDPAGSRRHLITRLGGVWIRAEGEPNIVQEGGDYVGVYGGVGFETDLTPRVAVGPELTVLAITRTTGLSVARPVPQVNWHVRVRPGSAPADPSRSPPLPRGELYGGVSAVVSPGVGGGVLLGQVFAREPGTTWAVEVSAAAQPPGSRLFFEEDGRWAQVQVGVKASLTPDRRGRWTGRGGAVWLRSTASNPFLDVRADHIGGYVGVGYDYDLTDALSTGPELNLMLVSYEQEVAFHLVPQLRWHVLVKP